MLNIINIIQSEARYRDRFHFFLSLDNKVETQIIYVQHYDSDITHLHNTVIKTPPARYKSGIKFWLWVSFDVVNFLKKRKKEKWIVVEHLTGFVLFFLKLSRFFLSSTLKLIHGIYSEDFYYFKNRIWRIDGPELLDKKQNQYYYFRWLKRVWRQRIYIWASDAIITNSPRMVDWVSKHTSKPVYRIFNLFKHKNGGEEEKEVKKVIDVLYVGNITPAKGIISMFKALEKIERDIKIVVVGKIKSQDQIWADKVLKRFSSLNLNIIDHLDWNDLKKNLKKSRLFVFPSYSEGSPRVLVEAMWFGCEILASDIPGNTFPYTFKNNPITYFEQGNHIELKNKINEKLQISPSDNGRKFISQFDENKIGSDLLLFYKTV